MMNRADIVGIIVLIAIAIASPIIAGSFYAPTPAFIGLEVLVQIVVWGLIVGCIYVLLASGLNLIFGVMKVVNFSHGEFMILGGYVSYWVSILVGLDPYLSIFVSMAVIGLAGVLTERICFRRVLGTSKLNEIILSLGLIYVLQNAMAISWSDKPIQIRSPFEFVTVSFGVVRMGLDWLIVIGVTVLIMAGFYILIKRTEIGRAIRATSQNRSAAMLMGINVERMDMFSFGVGTALAATAGTLLAILAPITPQAGAIPALKAFTIIVLGGLGSTIGAVVGGLVYGLVENSTVVLLGATWKDAIAFAILILVLIIRPTGLFGEKEA
jgi:branched-chain amino acid transport system permease protein